MLETIETPAIYLDNLRQAIQHEYTLVANEPGHAFHFLVGRPLAQLLRYDEDWLHGIPEPTIASFAGTGNPFNADQLQPGERVVDVGCGGGIDGLIAAKMVGPAGEVIGVDMTPAMLAKARSSAGAAGVNNLELREGFGEALPVGDAWADVVISNGVLLEGEIALAVTAAGFVAFGIHSRTDVYAGAEQSSSAANFGTLGITFRARKAITDDEWQEALTALSCDLERRPGS